MQEFGRVHAPEVSTSVVPSTIAYLISGYEEQILGPARQNGGNGELVVHLLGATYLFEGMSDWSWLARALPPDFPKARVDLILGSPWTEDGPTMDAKHRNVYRNIDIDEFRGQAEWSAGIAAGDSMLQVRAGLTMKQNMQSENKTRRPRQARDASDAREMSCGTRHFGNVQVTINCHEHIYQTVWDELPVPHLALMFNPGFPKPDRRSWDAVLQHLLNHSIPSAVSAERVYKDTDTDRYSREIRERPGQDFLLEDDSFDEVAQTVSTLRHFDAQVIGFISSPFPYQYLESEYREYIGDTTVPEEDADEIVVKNAVLEFFVGRKPGAAPMRMLAPMASGDLSDVSDQECAKGLSLPVSQSFQNAMVELCESSAPPCGDLRTVQDWLPKCGI